MDGDAVADLQTFPRKYGLPATLWLLRIISVFLCAFALIPGLEGYYGKFYLILLVLLVETPVLWLVFFQLNENSVASDYNKAARMLKGITIGGMIVILSTGF
jgi:4-hydroxybenzoate polyprenyltransferase